MANVAWTVDGRPRVPDLVALLDAPSEFPYLTVRYLRRRVQERSIPVWKVGRKVFLERGDLAAIPRQVPAVDRGRPA